MALSLNETKALMLAKMANASIHLFPEKAYFESPFSDLSHAEYTDFLVGQYGSIAHAAQCTEEYIDQKGDLTEAQLKTDQTYYKNMFRSTENHAFWITQKHLWQKKYGGKYNKEIVSEVPIIDRQRILVSDLEKFAFEFPQFIDLRKQTIESVFNAKQTEPRLISFPYRNFLLTGNQP